MNKIHNWFNTGLIIAVGLLVLVGSNQSASYGGGTRFQNGISADNTSPVAGEVRGTDLTITDDAVISGGSLTLTTSNSATSTAVIGCVQTYATSTATAISIVFNSIGTSSTNMLNSQTANGHVLWTYGSCPR